MLGWSQGMTSLCLWVVGVAIAFALYTYLGYPLLLMLLTVLRRRRPAAAGLTAWPSITIVLPVYNEEAVIRTTLENLLQLDYPADRRQILVLSDASTDRTDAIVREYARHGVQLVRMPRRRGKTTAENETLGLLHGDIIVNCDASARFDPGALKRLIASFADPTVGVASSTCVSVGPIDADANRGESSYLDYEMWVCDLETRFCGIVVAVGWFYAARASIQKHVLPGGLCRDFAAPLIARERGFRAVSVADAICFKPRAPSLRDEYRRKVRTITRGWHTLSVKRQLLNPFRYGAFAWILATHKVCRWLVPHVGVLALATLAWLVPSTPWAGWGSGLAGLAGLCAALGWWWPEGRQHPKLVAVPAYIVLGQLAALHASLRAVTGRHTPTWEPVRQEPGQPAAGGRQVASSAAGSGRVVLLVVSLDTEEDNWVATRSGITVENIRELRRLRRFFDGLGVRPTYFTTHQVAVQPWAADILREACDGGRAEIGAHLHPWNSPPIEEPLIPRNTMMTNLPPALQLEKLRRLTGTLEDVFGARPTAFRAGRFGLGAGSVSALLACDYRTDSSVTPFVSWEAVDEGPTFVGAPLHVYRIGEGQDVRVPARRGPLVEVPLTCGYTRWSPSRWPLVHRV